MKIVHLSRQGQFNYVNIVIKPLDYESNAVTLQAKEGKKFKWKDGLHACCCTWGGQLFAVVGFCLCFRGGELW